MPMRVKVPDSCADLCPAKVVRALERSFGQIPPAARELGVPIPDLRRLTWAQPKLLEEALEEHELAVSQAMGVVIQALYSDDLRRQMWASDKIMSSWLARDHPLAPARRGRAVEAPRQQVVFRWADSDPATDELDRDGQTLAVPRYGDRDECIEVGAVMAPGLIECPEPQPPPSRGRPEPPKPPVWPARASPREQAFRATRPRRGGFR
jgi:hypothetical protein